MSNFFFGMASCWRGLNIAYQSEYRRWLLLIIAINLVLMVAISTYCVELGTSWSQQDQSPWFFSIWGNWLGLGLDLLLLAALGLLGFYSASAIFSGPLLSFLCQQHLSSLGLFDPQQDQHSLITNIALSLKREVQKLIYFTPRWLAVIALSFVPLVNIYVWLVWGSRLVAMQYVDYPLDQRGYDFAEAKPHLRQHRNLYWGMGLTLQVVLLIPIFNVFLIPGAIIAANLSFARSRMAV